MCVYTPDAGVVGTDTFTYTISDGAGGTDTATVTVTVRDYADITNGVVRIGVWDRGNLNIPTGIGLTYVPTGNDVDRARLPVRGMGCSRRHHGRDRLRQRVRRDGGHRDRDVREDCLDRGVHGAGREPRCG